MQMNFPTILAQSISVAYRGVHPPALLTVTRQVPTGLFNRDDSPITKPVHVASERIPFEDAVQIQMEINRMMNVDDDRFGQKSELRLVKS